MKHHRRLIAAALLIAGITPAIAQTFPTVPSQTVIGRTAFGTGPAQAIPFSAITANLCNTFTLTLKGCVPAPVSTTGRYLSDDIATPWKALPTQQVVAGTGVSLNGTCSGSALNCTVNATAATQYVVPSRASAAGQDLSLLSAIRTLGYATPGDGGGATFKNVGSAAFIDSYITTFTITGGSAYSNGSFFGVIWQTGAKPFVIGTATVSGGVVTAVSVAYTPGNQCAVGDVFTTGSLAGGTGASITITGCSTPLASFTDSAGNHWQFVPETYPNVLQFGAKGDWNNVDASATDNFNAIQAAMWFATFKSSTSYDAGGYWGGKVIFPQGSFMACGAGTSSLIVANGVEVWGATVGSTIRMCNAFDAATVFIELCDPNWHFACFNASLRHMEVSVGSGTAYAIHSRATQDFGGLYNTYIFSNGGSGRGCVHFEKGDGGASYVGLIRVSCSANSNAPQIKIGNTIASGLNYGTTIVHMEGMVLGGASSGGTYQTTSGIQINGGVTTILGAHCESMPVCIEVNVGVTGNAEVMWLQNINAGSGAPAPTCTGVIQLTGINVPGNTVVSQIPTNGSCTSTIQNGQVGGTNFSGQIAKPITCVSGACT